MHSFTANVPETHDFSYLMSGGSLVNDSCSGGRLPGWECSSLPCRRHRRPRPPLLQPVGLPGSRAAVGRRSLTGRRLAPAAGATAQGRQPTPSATSTPTVGSHVLFIFDIYLTPPVERHGQTSAQRWKPCTEWTTMCRAALHNCPSRLRLDMAIVSLGEEQPARHLADSRVPSGVGVMPPPFAVPPQFWAQLQGGVPGSEADLSTFFQFTQQVSQCSPAVLCTAHALLCHSEL